MPDFVGSDRRRRIINQPFVISRSPRGRIREYISLVAFVLPAAAAATAPRRESGIGRGGGGGGGEGGGNKTSEKLTETRAAWYELFASIPDFSPVPADGGGG